jgi:pimeloyl-ACP methyl ester carboxylesterase
MRASRVFAGALAILGVACSGNSSALAPVDARVTVNGHPLHVTCRGGPGPTVIFEPGIGGDHSLWAIADRIRDRTFACLYDRPGDGEAPKPDRQRTARTDVADLHELLSAAGIAKPVVTVGHSYGGLVAWMEAAEHPDDVAGVVLIEPSHPHDLERLEAVMSDEQQQTFRAGFAGFAVDFRASEQEAASELGSFPPVPLTVITAAHSMDPWCTKGLPCASMQAVALELGDAYAEMRPDARHLVVPTSHYVQDDDPNLVVDEIVRLLDAVRGTASPRPAMTSSG